MMKTLLPILSLLAAGPARADDAPPSRLGRVALEQWVRTLSTSSTGLSLRALGLARADTSFVGDFRDGTSGSRFELNRLETSLVLAAAPHGFAVLTLETVRSAGPTSSLGIDGDALLVRARHAYGELRPELGPVRFEVSGGLVPDLFVRALEVSFPLRGLGPAAPERTSMLGASDLGANFGLELWDGRLRAIGQLTNGEGRSQVEQNSGKNLSVLLHAEPLRLEVFDAPSSLEVALFFRDGSVGPASGRDHRLGGFLSFTLARGAVGMTWMEAFGYRGRPELRARSIGGWLCAALVPQWVTVFGRLDVLDRDLGTDGSTALTAWAGVLSDVIDARDTRLGLRVRAFLAYQRESFGQDAGAVPGVGSLGDANRIFAGVELVGAVGQGLGGPGFSALGL